jgi:serine/threonine protein kinase
MISSRDSSTPVGNDRSFSHDNNPSRSPSCDPSTPEGLMFEFDLRRDSSHSATVCKTRSGSRVGIKRGFNNNDDIFVIGDLLSDLSHPALFSFSVIDDSEGRVFSLQQEFRSNGSLERILLSIFSGNPPSFWTQSAITRELLGIAFGLDYLHSLGFVYGSLHPSNLLFSPRQ